MQYNILEEPCFDVLTKKGQTSLGLRQLLLECHNIVDLIGFNPLIYLAIIRSLLLPIFYRTHIKDSKRGWSTIDWRAVFKSDKMDAKAICSYFDKFGSRFDLFDSERPFLQCPASSPFFSKTSSVHRLNFVAANGPALSSRLFDTEWNPVSAARAFHFLLQMQHLTLSGGGGGKYSDSLSMKYGKTFVILKGDTLFETILLNAIRYDEQHPFPSNRERDIPIWEHVENPLALNITTSEIDGWISYLTWQSRRVNLIPMDTPVGIMVDRIYFGAGLKESVSASKIIDHNDPFSPSQIDKDGKLTSVRLHQDRSLWRDSASLIVSQEQAANEGDESIKTVRPVNIVELSEKMNFDDRKREAVVASVISIENSPPKPSIDYCKEDHFMLPVSVIDSPFIGAEWRNAVGFVDAAENILRYRGRKIERELHSPTDGDNQNTTRHFIPPWTSAKFWMSIDFMFRDLLSRLGRDAKFHEQVQAHMSKFREDVRLLATKCFDEYISSVMMEGNGWKAFGEHVTKFRRDIKVVTYPPIKVKTESKKKAKTNKKGVAV